MKSICVFCGSSDAVSPDYLAAARQTGLVLAKRGLRLIYGGGKTGLMGAVPAGGSLLFGVVRASGDRVYNSVLAYLLIKSSWFPSWLGVILGVAGVISITSGWRMRIDEKEALVALNMIPHIGPIRLRWGRKGMPKDAIE